jgi:hypothetical protein
MPKPEMCTWQGVRDWSAELLEKRTGRNIEAWNRLIGRGRFQNQAALRGWLTEMAVTGYGQMLLVSEPFGYPDFMTAGANDLIGRQYADRPHLRPILDAGIETPDLRGGPGHYEEPRRPGAPTPHPACWRTPQVR